MSVSDTVKTNFVWKKIKGRRYTVDTKAWYEEYPGTLVFIHTDEVWADSIPTPAPGTTTSVVQYYDDLKLTEDTSTPDHRAWLACATPGDTSTQLTGFVPPRFHQSYTVRLFEDDGAGGIGNEIPTTHESNWFFDYENGVLVFENDPTSYGLTPPFHIKVYRYIGSHGSGGGSVTKLKAFLREASQVTVSSGSSSVDVSSQMTGKTPGGNETTTGVVTDPPYNRCPVLTYPDRDEILTSDGNKVFGRLTESGGTWTLSLKYIAEDGTETDYTVNADTNIIWGYYEVFDFDNWPVFDDDAVLPSDQVVGDIPQATTTQAGKVILAEDNETTPNEVVRADDPRAIKAKDFALINLSGDGSTISITVGEGVYNANGDKAPQTDLTAIQTANTYYLVYIRNDGTFGVDSSSTPPTTPDGATALYRFNTDASGNISVIADVRPIYLAGGIGGGSGKLGVPPDGTYDDGLLDFTSDTQINDAVDQINEVLKYLAPEDAEELTDLDFSNTFASGKISGGTSLNYLTAGGSSNYITRDNTLNATTSEPSLRFNKADLGELRLYINDTLDDTFDLAGHFNESEREGDQSYPPASSAGGKITVTFVGWHNNFPLWQRGNASLSIGLSGATDYKIKLQHYIDASNVDDSTEYIIFHDPESGRPGIASGPTVTEDTPVWKYLSGVKFYGANSTFKVSLTSDNKLFEYTYVDNPIHLEMAGMSPVDISLTDTAVSVPHNPPNYDDQLTLTDKQITLDSANHAPNDAKLTATPRDPWGNGTTAVEGTTEIRLVNTYGNVSTNLIEYFQDENYRLPSTFNFDDKTAAITGQWDSTQALTNGNAQVFNGSLIYPHINYTTGYLPSQTVDYSSFSGNQEYYRAISQTGTPHNSGKLRLDGITKADLDSGKIQIFIKLPTQTGWLDLSQPYNAATFTGADGDGAQTSAEDVSGALEVGWSSGTFSTADSGYRYYLKIVIVDSSIEVGQVSEIGW